MQIVCEECGAQGGPSKVWHSGDAIALECGECGHINRIEPAAPAPDSVTTSAPAIAANTAAPHASTQCPKCAGRQVSGAACHHCGFEFANYQAGEMPWDEIPEGKEDAWREAERRWRAVEASRDDEDAHEAFMSHCRGSGLEDFASRRYRFFLAEHPHHAAAQRQLEVMLALGQQRVFALLEDDRTRSDGRARRLRRGLIILVFVGSMAAVIGFLIAFPNIFR